MDQTHRSCVTYDIADRMTRMKSSANAATGHTRNVVDWACDETDQLQTADHTAWTNAPANENHGRDARFDTLR